MFFLRYLTLLICLCVGPPGFRYLLTYIDWINVSFSWLFVRLNCALFFFACDSLLLLFLIVPSGVFGWFCCFAPYIFPCRLLFDSLHCCLLSVGLAHSKSVLCSLILVASPLRVACSKPITTRCGREWFCCQELSQQPSSLLVSFCTNAIK